MTRTEQIKLVRRASRCIRIAEELNHTAFATLCIGVPLTMLAFAGFSPWPGVIYWALSWMSHSLAQHYTAMARRLHEIVSRAREER